MRVVLKYVFIFCFLIISQLGVGQGILDYLRWSADDGGPEKLDHIIVDLNYDGLYELPSDVTTKVSIGVNAFVMKDIPFGFSKFGMGIGLGISSLNIKSDGFFNYSMDAETGVFTTGFAPIDNYKFKKNKFSLTYLDVPIELRFRVNKDHFFRIYPGIKGGYLVNMHTKTIDEEIKVKYFNIKNTLKYHYGVTLRIAFDKFAINGFYSLSSVFNDNGPELMPFSVGITWMRL